MNGDEKPDAEAIRAFLRDLKTAPWLDEAQRHWPGHLFHVTDMRNAASILARGELLNRSDAMRLGVMTNDNASREIIAATDSDVLDAVRLYFRPRTPTAHNNEGIRPQRARVRDAHCPIPVMFVLKAAPILVRRGVRFSDGSLSRHGQAKIGDSAAFLRTIPFHQVYHEGPFLASDRDEIIFRRQAEVIVPKRLELEHCLRGVFTRSPAELETLESSFARLTDDHRLENKPLLRVNERNSLFFRSWTYLERVTVAGSDLRLEFNPSTLTPGPFVLRVVVTNADATTTFATVTSNAFVARGISAWRIPAALPDQIRIRIYLDDVLAYDAMQRRQGGLILPAL